MLRREHNAHQLGFLNEVLKTWGINIFSSYSQGFQGSRVPIQIRLDIAWMAECFCLLQTHATSRVGLKWGQGAHWTWCCHFKSFIAFDQVSQLIRNISKSYCLNSSSKSAKKLSSLLSEAIQQLQQPRRPQEGSKDDRPSQPARSQGGGVQHPAPPAPLAAPLRSLLSTAAAAAAAS